MNFAPLAQKAYFVPQIFSVGNSLNLIFWDSFPEIKCLWFFARTNFFDKLD